MPVRLPVRFSLTLLLAGAALAEPSGKNALSAVRFWTLNDTTRVVVETADDFQYKSDRVPDPDRLFFDLQDTSVRLGKKTHALIPVNDPRLKQIRVAEPTIGTSRVVFDLENNIDFTASRLTNPPRLIIELRKAKAPKELPKELKDSKDAVREAPVLSAVPPVEAPPERGKAAAKVFVPPPPTVDVTAKNAPPVMIEGAPLPKEALAAITPPVKEGTSTALGTNKAKLPPPPKPAKLDAGQSMTRVLGLKVGRIVLDAGHGGHDTGTIGPGGLQEKELVLDVCKRLGALVESRLGAEVVYTRPDDTFIPLERRTEIANQQKADLFLSIHANSSPVAAVSGIETYYLNFTDSKSAMEVAARENAGSAKTVYDLKDLLHKIALHDKIEESRQFASRVQHALYTVSAKANSRAKDRGIRKAPFVVLIGASMPSVLAEIGFVTNPRDEAMFRKPEFRQKIAEGLYQGISRYASTLSQFQVAQK